MTVYGYCRVSTTSQAQDGESLDTQKRQIEGRAMQEGWTVEQVFSERGVSGSKPLVERPQGRAMLANLQRGDTVIAAKLDRVFRSALDALQVCDDFRKRGVSLYLLDLGGDVTGNGVAGLFMKIAAAFAEFERDRITERIKDVKQDQRKRGRYLGGTAPFGYEIGEDGALVPIPAQQAAITRIHKLHEESRSLRAIAAAVEEDFGFKLSHMAVQRVLQNPV